MRQNIKDAVLNSIHTQITDSRTKSDPAKVWELEQMAMWKGCVMEVFLDDDNYKIGFYAGSDVKTCIYAMFRINSLTGKKVWGTFNDVKIEIGNI